MTPSELKKMSDEDITIEVQQLRRRLFDLRCQLVTEKIQNTSQFPMVRKDIARLLTEQNARNRAK
ncbi:MAG: 50S ribosomal protein L29 [Phycisphaerae bacterium]|jgi:large subunit ribosomal protein L29|nr:50S ribosomal protein L29 [Phycisphaerae bacterium]|tara:strand:- start:8930 stop:9124 length:195 start_codon:yes stop_codon:yes gene_type:complete